MYSQLNEDDIIARYFGGQVGTFMDIGANDGKTFSNTHALALAGWYGVCVDASPKAFHSLGETYADNDRIQCIHAAITTTSGPATLHQASDTLVSSLNSGQPEAWKAYGFQWEGVEVPGMVVSELLAMSKYPTFDFISIDAEGHDLSILEQMDLAGMGLRLVCVEHNNNPAAVKALCKGFKEYARNDLNIFLAR